jgi:hypothetical protein
MPFRKRCAHQASAGKKLTANATASTSLCHFEADFVCMIKRTPRFV